MNEQAQQIDRHFQAGLKASNDASQAVVSLAGEIQRLAEKRGLPSSPSFCMNIASGISETTVKSVMDTAREKSFGKVTGQPSMALIAQILNRHEFKSVVLEQVDQQFELLAMQRKRHQSMSPEQRALAESATLHKEMPPEERIMSATEAAGQIAMNKLRQAERDDTPTAASVLKATEVPAGVTYGPRVESEAETMRVIGVDDRASKKSYPAKKTRKGR